MCGIVGYVGSQRAASILLEGLAHLEYRGYDSAGIAVAGPGGSLTIRKAPGKLSALVESMNGDLLDGSSGIGHTRWATHGGPTLENAHPHADCAGSVVIVHNGIVENYLELKEELLDSGHTFASETDTEVMSHLIEQHLAAGHGFEEAVRLTACRVRGAQALVAMQAADPTKLVAFRLGNAGGITVGYGKGEMYLASDLPALLSHTNEVAYLAPGELVTVDRDGASYRSIEGDGGGGVVEKIPQRALYDSVAIAKGGYRHFMLKEIMEQPEVISKPLGGRLSFDPGDVKLEEFPFTDSEVKEIDRVVLTGMGTSLHASQVGRFYMEGLAGITSEADNASELRYREPIMDKRTLLVSVGQSGETVDTLGAMEMAARLGARQITVCNVEGSQATRMAHGTVTIGVGPEICVASTKCMTGALVSLYLLACYLGKARGTLDGSGLEAALQELTSVPRLMGQALLQAPHIEEIAGRFFRYDNFLYLGRGINMPMAMEGALKLKEVSYIHAEGYAAGEMKHGPISLIDENVPVLAIALRDQLYDKMRANIEEVKARGGTVIAVVTEGDEELASRVDEVIEIPEVSYLLSPMVSAIPLQLFAYYVAVRRGCDVDQPRNLAKTVTVE